MFSRYDNEDKIFMIISILVMFFLGSSAVWFNYLEYKNDEIVKFEKQFQIEAIENGCVVYNSKTGVFEWIKK